MNRVLSTLMMLFICLTIYSQQISREEVDSFNIAVIKSKPDTG